MQSFRTVVFLLFLLVMFVQAGCASSPRTPAPTGVGGVGLEVAAVDFDALPIFDAATGLPTSWDSLVAVCARADVVLIGEMHSHPVGLAVAARLFEQAASRKPKTAALSMEFFNRDKQGALDDYLAGLVDEEAFVKAAGRKQSNYPAGHRAMIETAHRLDQPVIASNAPRQYTRVARKEGYDRLRELTDEQRRLFTIPEELSSGGYRDSFFGLMSGMMAGHGGGGGGSDDAERTPEERAEAEARMHEMVLGFFRSQNLWDATMAEAVAGPVRAGRSPVFHVVGQFHVDHEGGLTQRLRALLPDAEIIVVTMSDQTGGERSEEDAERADWIINVGPAE